MSATAVSLPVPLGVPVGDAAELAVFGDACDVPCRIEVFGSELPGPTKPGVPMTGGMGGLVVASPQASGLVQPGDLYSGRKPPPTRAS